MDPVDNLREARRDAEDEGAPTESLVPAYMRAIAEEMYENAHDAAPDAPLRRRADLWAIGAEIVKALQGIGEAVRRQS